MAKKTVVVDFGRAQVELELPQQIEVLSMTEPPLLENPQRAVLEALEHPVGTPAFRELAEAKLGEGPNLQAVIVVSDNTRPVPYKGEQGILWPVVQELLAAGWKPEQITVLVATGTHRPLTDDELREMLDSRIFASRIRVVNHDCRDESSLVEVGRTSRGTRAFVNRLYVNADLKVLTGLVESHFMAGVSGGRKSVCPGLLGEAGTYTFHGAKLLSSANARDLVLEGNPCHEEALEVARLAGVDFIVNVTLDHNLRLTGVFAGELEEAHLKAVDRLREYVEIPIAGPYDAIVTHAGYVGINHYQAAKAAVAALPAIKEGGHLILGAHTTDTDPIGGRNYRTALHLLALNGPAAFERLILSPDWSFVPEQWEVQMWSKVFRKVPAANFVYCCPQLSAADAEIIPGVDGNSYLPIEQRSSGEVKSLAPMMQLALDKVLRKNPDASIAFLRDGPYGIPVVRK